jgi:hypothetical protein
VQPKASEKPRLFLKDGGTAERDSGATVDNWEAPMSKAVLKIVVLAALAAATSGCGGGSDGGSVAETARPSAPLPTAPTGGGAAPPNTPSVRIGILKHVIAAGAVACNERSVEASR